MSRRALQDPAALRQRHGAHGRARNAQQVRARSRGPHELLPRTGKPIMAITNILRQN